MQQSKKPVFSKHTDDAWADWCQTREGIGKNLREFYRANITDELPPRLVELVKKLNQDVSHY
jgi:hypothetical protein